MQNELQNNVSEDIKTEDVAEIQPLKESFSVMTFNIQHSEIWKSGIIDLDAFAEYIKAQDPDICGLNEVRGKGIVKPDYTNQAAILGAKADYNNYFGESVKIFGSEPYGNALLSKTALKSAECVKIPDIDDGAWHETRSIIKAVTEIQGKELCVLVSHFGLCDEERKNAVEKVCELIDGIELPTILMGDFNMRPDDENLAAIRERMEDTDSVAEQSGDFTFATYDPHCKIDYVFYRGLNCLSAKVIKEPLSDHFPIICEFSVE